MDGYITYSTKWLLLAVFCTIRFVQNYPVSGFVTLNNAISQFYKVTPYEVDLLSIVGCVASFPVALAAAYFSQDISFRFLFLGNLFMMLIGCILCGIGFFSRHLFWLTATSRFLMEAMYEMTYTIQAILSTRWFPKEETATAFSLPLFLMMVSKVIGSVAFPQILPTYNDTAVSVINGTSINGPAKLKLLFISTFGALSLLIALCVIFSWFYATNYPPSPPSRSQELDMTSHEDESHMNKIYSMWEIVKQRQFLLISASTCLNLTVIILSSVLMPSTVLIAFPELDYTVPGNILLISTIAPSWIVIISGKLIDKTKAFKVISIAGTTVAILSCVAIYFSLVYHKLELLFVFYTLLNSGRNIFHPAMLELLVETTYPVNMIRLMSILAAMKSLSVFFISSMIRFSMTHIGNTESILISIGIMSLSLFLLLLVKPKYLRMEADLACRISNENPSEKTSLLSPTTK